ncbi:MAG: DUF86 domain-containing protein [Candidatus Omnitrophica bacterium]|nr:DUF86 domain-containing protein [Candidatus Omnitrophota bacterium]
MVKRDYRDYVQDIVDCISEIYDFVGEMSLAQFKKDKKTQNAVLRSVEVMGEAAKNIPAAIKEKHPGVPWKAMAGMRDKLIHEYSGVDLEIVWNLIKQELPEVRPLVLKVRKSLNNHK